MERPAASAGPLYAAHQASAGQKDELMTLRPGLSAYLDLLRFVAAFAVLLGHMDQDGMSIAWMPLALFSHDAVIVFFVLSGFIIYFSTTARSSTWKQYAVARMSRIYSVALPSVLFCVLLALWLSRQPGFDPAQFSNYMPASVLHTVSSLLFLNKSWMNEATVPLNDPYWSLCYEVWYYVLFGVFFFKRGRKRWLWCAIAAAVAGPGILVLLPVWLMGAWLAASGRYASHWPQRLAWLAFVGPIVLMALIKLTDTDLLIRSILLQQVPGFWRITFSQRFVTDYLIGAALCLHIAAFSSLPAAVQVFFARHQGMLTSLAGFSFTLYLFHRPMTQLLGAWYPQPAGAVWQTAFIALGILLACWLISWGTEKQLTKWRQLFGKVFAMTAQGTAPGSR